MSVFPSIVSDRIELKMSKRNRKLYYCFACRECDSRRRKKRRHTASKQQQPPGNHDEYNRRNSINVHTKFYIYLVSILSFSVSVCLTPIPLFWALYKTEFSDDRFLSRSARDFQCLFHSTYIQRRAITKSHMNRFDFICMRTRLLISKECVRCAHTAHATLSSYVRCMCVWNGRTLDIIFML